MVCQVQGAEQEHIAKAEHGTGVGHITSQEGNFGTRILEPSDLTGQGLLPGDVRRSRTLAWPGACFACQIRALNWAHLNWACQWVLPMGSGSPQHSSNSTTHPWSFSNYSPTAQISRGSLQSAIPVPFSNRTFPILHIFL